MKKILDKDDYKQLNIIDVTGLFEYIVINDSSLSLEDELMMIISAIKGELDVSGELYFRNLENTKLLQKISEYYFMQTGEKFDLDALGTDEEYFLFEEFIRLAIEFILEELDDEYKSNYLKGKNSSDELIYFENAFNSQSDFRNLVIESLKTDALKVEVLKNRDIIDTMSANDIVSIIVSLENDQNKINCLKDENVAKILADGDVFGSVLDKIIDSLDNEQSIIECLEMFPIDNYFETSKLTKNIQKIKSRENLLECVMNKKILDKLYDKLGILSDRELEVLTKTESITDEFLLKEIRKARDSIFYDSFAIYVFISLLLNENLKIECLKDEKILEKLLSNDITSILCNIADKQMLFEVFENEYLLNKIYDLKLLTIILTLEVNQETINKFTDLLLNPVFSNKILSLRDNNLYEKILPYLKENIRKVFLKCVNSNSTEIEKLGFNMILSESISNPDEKELERKFNEIEKIFLKNNLPFFAKLFLCFQNLYPNLSKISNGNEYFDFRDDSRISPTLQDDFIMKVMYRSKYEEKKKEMADNPSLKRQFDKRATFIRFIFIFNDLLRIAIASNNQSLREYLENIEKGNNLYLKILDGSLDINKLNIEDNKILNIFISHLEMLYSNTKEGKNKEINLENKTIIEKIDIFKELFKVNDRYDLPDRIIRSFCYYAGFKSFKELKNAMDDVVNYSNQKNIKNANLILNKKFMLEEGDFLRCIGSLYSLRSLSEGNVCKEMLGGIIGKSNTDTTALDSDWTRLLKKDIEDSLYDTIDGTPTGFGFGDIYVVIKANNPNIYITRNKNGIIDNLQYNPGKISMFQTGYESHYGAEIGTGTGDIDYIIFNDVSFKNLDSSNLNDKKIDKLSVIKYEVAKSGIYIPIVNMEGILVFTEDEYNIIRNKMGGLKHYNVPYYNLSDYSLDLPNISICLDNGESMNVPSVEEIEALFKESDKKNKSFKTAIFNKLSDFIVNNTEAKVVYPEIMGDLTRGIAELIGTGSTARGTNLPNDADYDYILRIDKQELLNNTDFVTRLKKYLNPTEIIPSKSNRFRGKAIHTISNYENIDFDIDVTFTGKTNKMDYSTDMALTERLNAIKEQHPDSYDKVRANIIMAKSLLKQAGVYKSSKSDPKQGGLGGVGIENWILQNNGSLEQAIDEFLEAAQNENGELFPFEEFKKKYHIWDFGANHDPYIPGYPYDDFVEFNMTEKGYEKMCNVLIKYKNELNKSNNRNK